MPRRAGMTLLELLVATAIASMVMMGLYTAVAVGVTAWRRLRAAPSLEVMVALERMSRRFATAPVFSGMPCSGIETSVAFPALVTVGAEAPARTLGRVEYSYDAATKAWCMQEQTYGGYLAKSAPATRQCLVTGVTSATVEYLLLSPEKKTSKWLAHWPPVKDDEPEGAEPPPYPFAIRATLVVEDAQGHAASYLKSTVHWVQ